VTAIVRRPAARRVGSYPVGSRGVDTATLAERLEADIARIEAGTLVPGPDAVVEPLTV
jgi:hypothetical protein